MVNAPRRAAGMRRGHTTSPLPHVSRRGDRDSVRSDVEIRHSSGDDAGDSEDQALIRYLETEFGAAREEAESLAEQLASSNEDYRASHEELLSLNEELQSSNEELEKLRPIHAQRIQTALQTARPRGES